MAPEPRALASDRTKLDTEGYRLLVDPAGRFEARAVRSCGCPAVPTAHIAGPTGVGDAFRACPRPSPPAEPSYT